MIMKRFAGLMSVAFALCLGAGDLAKADYNYTTSIVVTSATAGATITNTATSYTVLFGGTTVTLTNVSRGGFTVPGPNTINIGDISVSSITPLTGSDTFTINYRDTFTLTNVPPPGTAATGSFPLTGTLTFTGINTGSGVITNEYTGSTSSGGVLGGITFTGQTLNFASPTVNGSAGSLGGLISSTAVIPEPASVVMLGLGLGGIGLVRLRSRRAQG